MLINYRFQYENESNVYSNSFFLYDVVQFAPLQLLLDFDCISPIESADS